MNINKDQIDDLSIIVSIEVGKDDYESKVNSILRDYRRKANMPGFRPGKVPEGLVRKLYGKAVLVDELNKLVSDSLQNYIKDQELRLLGDPLPKAKNDDFEWEIGSDFTFDFEIGLAPVIDVQLSKEDSLTKYQITVEQDMIHQEVMNIAARYGQFIDADAVVDFQERLEGDIIQLGDEQPLPDGLSAEDTMLMMALIKEEKYKKPFENAKAGDEIVFNLSETFSNDWEISSILKKKTKEETGNISGFLFRFTVKSVKKFANAEVNQELFDKAFGEGTVSNEKEFEERIKENIAKNFEERCFVRFIHDARQYLLEKINPPLPEDHLRKWMLFVNKDKDISEDVFEKEFPMFLKTMKWDLIVKSIAKQYEIGIEENEIIDFAKSTTLQQLMMYGLNNPSDEILTRYAMDSLKDEKNIRDVAAQVLERKIVKVVSENIDTNTQEMSLDDYNQMFYASNSEKVEVIEENKEIEETE